MLRAISATNVVEYLVAAATTKIQVNVGWVTPRRAEKALEEQVVGNRINSSNTQTKSHERIGNTAPRAHGDLLLAGITHDIGNDQKERRVTVTTDDLDLTFQTRGCRFGNGQPKTGCQTGARGLTKCQFWGNLWRQIAGGPDSFASWQCRSTGFRKQPRTL
ncbi:MAG: hypothetical protein BWY63_00851 [Chloroflexi bacterium ADurb.Bin360]|nr:MAG: hypothetical protein BWY63_00851 [Chloroflexi bacterium ADurb.Bin360]